MTIIIARFLLSLLLLLGFLMQLSPVLECVLLLHLLLLDLTRLPEIQNPMLGLVHRLHSLPLSS